MSNDQADVHSGEGVSSPNDFGELLRRFRLRQGFSQQELAQAVFQSSRKSSISELENSPTRVPQPNTLRRLAAVLHLSDEERSQLAEAAQGRRRPPIPRQPPAPRVEFTGPEQPAPGEAAAEAKPEVRSSPDQPSPKVSWARGPSWTPWIVVATIAVVLLGIGVVALMRPGSQSDGNAGSPAMTAGGPVESSASTMRLASHGAAIEQPADGQQVTSPLDVSGSARLDAGEDLWLLLRPVKDTTFYTTTDKPIDLDISGHWLTRPRIGRGPQDVGYEFDLLLVVSPRGGLIDQAIAARSPDQYSARLHSVPFDATVTDRMRLIVGRYAG